MQRRFFTLCMEETRYYKHVMSSCIRWASLFTKKLDPLYRIETIDRNYVQSTEQLYSIYIYIYHLSFSTNYEAIQSNFYVKGCSLGLGQNDLALQEFFPFIRDKEFQ